MAVRLTRLSIENFRGIRSPLTIPWEKEQWLLVIGENGSGKSSIVDALEYLFSGEIERLKRQDVREKQCIPFIGAKDKDVRIRLQTTQGDLEVGYPYQRPSVSGVLSEWFCLASTRPFILRRAQILKFVEAKAADRYTQISLLIGLEQLDEIERIWRKKANEWNLRKSEEDKQAREAEQSLRSLVDVIHPVDVIHADEALVVASINQRLQNSGLLDVHPISTMADLPSLREMLQTSQQVTQAAQRVSQMIRLCERLRALEETTKGLLESYREFYTEWKKFVQAKETLKEALFRILLEKGAELLSQYPEIDGCPLCGAPVSREDLIRRIRQRLKELEDIQQREKQLERMLASLKDQVVAIDRDVKDAAANPEAIVHDGLLGRLKRVESGLDEVRTRLNQRVIGDNFVSPQDLWQASSIQILLQEIPGDADEIEKRARDLQPSETERQRIELSVWLERLERAWQEWEKARRRQEQVSRVYEQVNKVQEVIKTARQERLKEIHGGIEKRVNDYYQRLHPQEGCEIRLPVETRGGVGLRTRFHTVDDSHPLGFYSEGHLDTLGIVIFLAFIKEFNRDDKGKPLGLLVLDDVLTTVDNGHRQRVASLLCEEFRDYQVLVTTHDRLWAEMLLTTMRSTGIHCRPLYLMPWDVRVGVTCRGFLENQWDEYRERAKTDVPSAVGSTGRDLEKFLWQMRYNLRLSVPARPDDRYTINDLYGPFFKWFKSHSIQVPDFDFDKNLRRLRDDLDKYWLQRNWVGSHYNSWGETLAYKEAVEFIDLVQKLVKMFQCPRCGALVEYDEDCSVIVCRKCKDKSGGANWRVIKKG